MGHGERHVWVYGHSTTWPMMEPERWRGPVRHGRPAPVEEPAAMEKPAPVEELYRDPTGHEFRRQGGEHRGVAGDGTRARRDAGTPVAVEGTTSTATPASPSPGPDAPLVLIVALEEREIARARLVLRTAAHDRHERPQPVRELIVSSIADALVAYGEELPAATLLSPRLLDHRVGRGAQMLEAVEASVPVITLPVVSAGTDLRSVAMVRRALRRSASRRGGLERPAQPPSLTGPPSGYLTVEQARRDELTGLADRPTLCSALDHLAGRGRLSAVAVVAVGLDHFSRINEGYGQSTGDAVLRRVAESLAAVVPEDGLHLLARIGGDTFALVADGVDDLPAAHFVADRLASVVVAAVDEFSLDLHPTASTGIVLGTSAHGSDLLSHAETALREARRSGGHRSVVFDHPLKGRVLSRSHLEAALRVAIEERQFRLHYQPIVEVATGRVRGFEALVRWLHPEDGLLGPDRFIGTAEETGLIRPLGAWVLTTAVRRLDQLHRAHPDLALEMAVNVSARQLDDPTLLDTLVEALAHLTAAPSQLCLEITESALLGDAEQAAETLRAARALGVRVALDDFGTGYSSLSQIRTIAIDVLKIDQSFVAGLTTCPEDALVVDAVVDLGTHLGFTLIAEGVETEEQCRRLLAMGCRLTQGFLWSRPVPGDLIEGILEASARGAYRLRLSDDTTDHAIRAHGAGPTTTSPTGPSGADPRTGLPPGDDAGGRPPEPSPDGVHSVTELHDALVVLSHELRTPIHVIHGFAQLLAQDLDGEDDSRRSAVEAIVRQAEEMTAMVDSLVDARAVDTGTLRIDHDLVDLSGLVGQLCEDLRHTLGDHPLRLVAPGRADVVGDAGRLRQIVTNLLVNAAKFAPGATPIDLVVTSHGPWVTVNVRDRGPGVAPDQVGSLFRKFSRLGSSRPGTGLGLYLARGLARAHGGDLRYRDAPGGGADFELTIPAGTS